MQGVGSEMRGKFGWILLLGVITSFRFEEKSKAADRNVRPAHAEKWVVVLHHYQKVTKFCVQSPL